MKIKCDYCTREFKPGNQPNGIPNGIGFQMKDGRILNLCHHCLMKMGRHEPSIMKFIEEFGKQ